MPDVRRLLGLAEAAGYLWHAQEELAAAGYPAWVEELGALIATIAMEIDWLADEASQAPAEPPTS
jgi:hypothetical protein